MKKFTTASEAGATRAKSYMSAEPMAGDQPQGEPGVEQVDPSVRIGPLQGEQAGSVPINSPAYTGKFK